MKRWFIVFVLIVAVVIGAGFYMGYLHVGADSTDGVTHVTLTIDHRKLQADEKKAEDKAHDVVHPPRE